MILWLICNAMLWHSLSYVKSVSYASAACKHTLFILMLFFSEPAKLEKMKKKYSVSGCFD